MGRFRPPYPDSNDLFLVFSNFDLFFLFLLLSMSRLLQIDGNNVNENEIHLTYHRRWPRIP